MSWDGEATGEVFGEEAIFVALGTNLKKGKAILKWVFEHLPNREVVVLHVHKPPKLIPMDMGGKFPIHMAAPEEAAIYIEAKRVKMNALVHAYTRFCDRHRVSAKTLVIETDDVFKGIVFLVGQHQIKKLVMGLRSINNEPILEGGLLACQIWLVYSGKLFFSREALMQQIRIEMTGDESRCDFITSSKSAEEISSCKNAKERSSTCSAAELSSVRSSKDSSSACSLRATSSIHSARELSSVRNSKDSSSVSSLRETSSPKSVKEISSLRSVKESTSPKNTEETSESRESDQGYMALVPNESWSMKPAEEPIDPSLKVEETEIGSSNETCETEDISDLAVQLAEVVHVLLKQRLDMARQMLVLKQEFIEFSLPELEDAAKQLNARDHT